MRGTTKFKVVQGCFITFIVICCLFVLYPIVFVVSTAFSTKSNMASASIIPFADGISLKQFENLFWKYDFILWFKNTFVIALGVMIVTVLTCALAAYVFSRFKFAFKKPMMMAMLILQIFPSFVGMQALYVIADRVGAHDQLWGLIIIYAAGNVPYNTWLVKSYLDTIPKTLDEAARIDGANHVTIFFKVIFPIARPIVIFLAITSFTGPWMDWIFPKLILSSPEKFTLAMGLIAFVDGTKNNFTLFAAGAVTIAIPFIIFFIFSQSAMMTGLGGGAVKE